MSDIQHPRPSIRRRFALTLAALGVGTIAIPFYLVSNAQPDAATPAVEVAEVRMPGSEPAPRGGRADAKAEGPRADPGSGHGTVSTSSESAPPPAPVMKAAKHKAGLYAMDADEAREESSVRHAGEEG